MAIVFGRAMEGIHGPDSGLSEIENKETGENFLEDQIRFLCVEMDQAYGVFQTAERCFNAPAYGVEVSQLGNRKLLGIQVGDKGFYVAAIGQQTDDAKGYFIEIGATRL